MQPLFPRPSEADDAPGATQRRTSCDVAVVTAFLHGIVSGPSAADDDYRTQALLAIAGLSAAEADAFAATLPPARAARVKAAARIAHDGDLCSLTGDPGLWPWTVAYLALGGRVIDGVVVDLKMLRDPDWRPLDA